MAVVTKMVTVTSLTLELSREEAQAIRDVLSRVGGSPTGRRQFTDAVTTALEDVGITSSINDSTGAVYFEP